MKLLRPFVPEFYFDPTILHKKVFIEIVRQSAVSKCLLDVRFGSVEDKYRDKELAALSILVVMNS